MTTHDGLAERYGTPLYVYDLDRVATAREDLHAALPAGFELFYALKANPHPDVARTLAEGGCRAEVSSTGELTAALDAGFHAAEILYTGPGKTGTELATAIAAGVRQFSAESEGDLRHIGAAAARAGVTARCLLRVNAVAAGATTGIRMMGRPSQFGIDSETLPELMPRLRAVPGAEVAGAHLFTMSNAADEAALIAELDRSVALAARLEDEAGLPLELLDIGGGFAAPYAVPGDRPRYPGLRAALEQVLDTRLPRWRDGSLRLACESGRYLVADSGWLLTSVVNLKESRGHRFVIADAGINAVGGLSGTGRLLPAAVGVEDAAGGRKATLVGPLCTPGDLLGRDIALPDVHPGDVLAIPNTGAYGITASLMGFLGRPAPAEVAIRGGAVVSVSRLEPQRVHHRQEAAVG